MPIRTFFSRRGQYPKLGRINLGVWEQDASGKRRGAGKELPYFVLPEELRSVLPENPTAIDVSFPSDDPDQCFDHWYERWDSGFLAVRCDGETCRLYQDQGQRIEDVQCQRGAEAPKCACGAKATGRLYVIVRKAKAFGVYEVAMGGYQRCRNLMGDLLLYRQFGLSRAWFTMYRREALQRYRDEKTGDERTRRGYPVRVALHYNPEMLLGDMRPMLRAHTPTSEPAPEIAETDEEEAGESEAPTPMLGGQTIDTPHEAESRAATRDANEDEPSVAAQSAPSADADALLDAGAPWDISASYAAAKRLGIDAATYTAYLRLKYVPRTESDLAPAQEAEQERMLRRALAEPDYAVKAVAHIRKVGGATPMPSGQKDQ